jgi:hypothetical protein
MDISRITFPLYKLRAYLNIDKTALGKIKITTIKGEYILDDISMQGLTFEERRARLPIIYPLEKVYKLKEKVLYLRQLVKYKSGTTFIDMNGVLLQYKKSSKLFNVNSYLINRKRLIGNNWTVIYLKGHEQPYLIGFDVGPSIGYASVMDTEWGPLLYDLTSIKHETYRRKI